MHSMPIGILAPYTAGEGILAPSTPSGEAGKDGRAPRGAVRKAVTALFLRYPQGLPLSGVMKGAAEIDPNISEHSVSNELNRNKGTRYSNDGGVWRMIATHTTEEVEEFSLDDQS